MFLLPQKWSWRPCPDPWEVVSWRCFMYIRIYNIYYIFICNIMIWIQLDVFALLFNRFNLPSSEVCDSCLWGGRPQKLLFSSLSNKKKNMFFGWIPRPDHSMIFHSPGFLLCGWGWNPTQLWIKISHEIRIMSWTNRDFMVHVTRVLKVAQVHIGSVHPERDFERWLEWTQDRWRRCCGASHWVTGHGSKGNGRSRGLKCKWCDGIL